MESGSLKKKFTGVLHILRPSHWLKNVFLFVPLIFSKHLFDPWYVQQETCALICFCLVSSLIYAINDLTDREADALHPIKKSRPLASGQLRTTDVLVIIALLFAGVLALLPLLPKPFWYTVVVYGALNIAYSMRLKQVVIVDVFIIASGFMLRVLGGAFAIEVLVSPWLVLCTLFVSLFLAVSKRRGELLLSASIGVNTFRPVLKQYDLAFIDQLMTVAASGMAISYALYTVADRTVRMFGSENLMMTTIFVLFGIFRYIFLMRQRKTDDNPMHLLVSDIPSIVNMFCWFICCIVIIYYH